MAARKIFRSKSNYIYPTSQTTYSTPSDNFFEFDESDIWNSTPISLVAPSETKSSIPNYRLLKKQVKKLENMDRINPVTAASLPVNIPDWSKILKDDEEENNGGGESWIPPHEYLARKRGASFSVHEGVGRTLKGRDLSRVRNAIWKKTGFED